MKKHSKILIIFAITLSCAIYRFCAAECLAQTIKKINLDDAIELSLSNNLDLQSARIDLELAKNDIKSSNRAAKTAYARQIAIYLAKEFTNESFPFIGDCFNRKHTTIMYSHQKVKKDIEHDMHLARDIQELTDKINS